MSAIENIDIMVKEFEDHSQDIERRLLKIENKKLKTEDVEEISRVLHSIKGLLGFLGKEFEDIVEIVHGIEDKLLEQNKQKKISPEFFQELINLVDSVKQLAIILPEGPSHTKIKGIFSKLMKSKSEALGLKMEKEFKLDLYVDENLKMKSTKVLSMFNILKQICTLKDSNPSLEMLLDSFDSFSKIEIYLTTRKSENDLKAVIRKFHDVKKFELVEEEIKETSSKPEEMKSSKVSKQDYAINSKEMVKISGILEEFIRMEKIIRKIEITNLPKHEQQLINSFKRKILEIQESITVSNELPLKIALDPLPRLVRDLSKKYEKDVEFYTLGDDIPLNRAILEKLTDPLVIIISNAIAHGIESNEERKKVGKNGKGIIRVEARQNQGITSLRIFDNGRGIDFSKIWKKGLEKGLAEGDFSESKAKQMLFLPGFSTIDDVSTLAGRGMGLSQVRKFIIEMNGKLNVSTNLGKNTTFEMVFPVQNSIASTILVEVNNLHFGFPETHVRKIQRLRDHEFELSDLNSVVFPYMVGDNPVKTINLTKIFNPNTEIDNEGSILLWNNGLEELGFYVNNIITFEEMAINYSDPVADISPLFSGTASVGSGDVVFLLHPQAFMESYNL